MKFLSKVSYSHDNVVAVHELLAGLERTHEIACLICYCTEEYSTFSVQELLKQQLPDTPVHGCTTCHGIMTETGFHSGPVIGVLAIYDSGINAYGTGIQSFESDVTSSTHHAIDMALRKADRIGEVPDLILLHSTPGNEETVMNAIDAKFGTEVPIIGGSAADTGSALWILDGKEHQEQHSGRVYTVKVERINERRLRTSVRSGENTIVHDWDVSADGKTLEAGPTDKPDARIVYTKQ